MNQIQIKSLIEEHAETIRKLRARIHDTSINLRTLLASDGLAFLGGWEFIGGWDFLLYGKGEGLTSRCA